jgi:hypothetical protein
MILEYSLDCFLFFIILMGPLPLSLFLIAIAIPKKNDDAEYFAHWLLILLTLWCIIENAIGVSLGIINRLNLTFLVIFEILIFFTGILLIFYSNRNKEKIYFLKLFPSTKLLRNYEALIAILFIPVALLVLYRVSIVPITDYDSLAYHLPHMANWYQTGSLTMLDQWKYGLIGRYPYGWEVLCTLFLFPFKEDFMVAFPNFISWLLFGLSIYLLGRKFGANRVCAIGSASLVLITRIVFRSVNTMHVDLPFATLFMIGLYFGILYNEKRSHHYLALFLATLGMLLGIKTSAIVYIFLLVAVIVTLEVKRALLCRNISKSDTISFGLIPLFYCVAILSFLLLGCFWYIRNLIDTGNPFGYLNIQLGNTIIFSGKTDISQILRTTLSNLFDIGNLSHWKILLLQILNKMGSTIMPMLFLTLLLVPGLALGRLRMRSKHIIGISILLICTSYLYWNTAFSGDNGSHGWQITPWIGGGFRYAFPALGILGIASSAIATRIGIKEKTVAAITIVSWIPNTIFILSGKLAISLIFVQLVLFILWRYHPIISQKDFFYKNFQVSKMGIIVLITLGLTGTIGTTVVLRQKRDDRRLVKYHGILEYIDENIPDHHAIGYFSSHRAYLFYGKNFTKKVLYLPPKSKSIYMWLNTLNKSGVRVIALGPLQKKWKQEYKMELEWLNDPGGPFEKVFDRGEGGAIIYRIKSGK